MNPDAETTTPSQMTNALTGTGTSTGATGGSNGPATSVTSSTIGNNALTTGSQGYTQFNGDSLTPDPALGGINTSGANTLSAYLTANPESDQESSIMDRYNSAAGGINTAASDTAQSIQDYYNENLASTNIQNTSDQDSAKEAMQGFATNTAALSTLQATGAKRINDLTNSRDAALLSNNADQATALSGLITQEQTAITTARQNWVANLVSLSQAQLSNATSQTPEQQAVMTLATTYPGAGITASDTLASASQKAQNSPNYRANLAATTAGANASNAAAGESTAGAANTRTLTSLYASPNAQGDVTALLNGSATPAEIQAKYQNYPGGAGGTIAANIIAQAQSQGYSLNQGTLTGQAQGDQTNAENSGNALTSITSYLSNLGGGLLNSLTGNAPATTFGANGLATGTGTSGTTSSGLSYTMNP